MKKLFLLFFAVFLAAAGFAQPFVLTTDGFRDCKDTMKDYIVVQVPDTDKATLFQRAKNYFTMIYNSPQKVMSESGMDMISVMGGESIRCKCGYARGDFKFSYKLVSEFRDGRVKFTPVWVGLSIKGKAIPLSGSAWVGGVYRDDGKLRDDEAKTQMESIINLLVTGLEKALKEESAPALEDW